MTTDSNQIFNVAPPTNPSQRLLRAHHIAIQVDADSEERSLAPKEMNEMMKKLTTKEAYASELGILDKINSNLNGGALMRFMQTHEYQKYRAYMNYLNAMQHDKKYAKLVAKIKGK
ncbi:hypothetical protein JG687_00007274 [Phytophthora cactorum]|nr:hypothetical protein Pcac1_g11435 [Phytophthora cactorum]KAG2830102.1 hypothetical protein PC112_g7843 [Phytophthora cactorum]KAG2830863.1 hypothetical protein PC111_g7224 [Phytophthora cactorum]KAG2860445.1 hypothetical protein PC113_g8074 [Phytophthora cactorum]KAG2914841.1 hypothetical protein PC114_g8040 [Phytophthora cactorum]